MNKMSKTNGLSEIKLTKNKNFSRGLHLGNAVWTFSKNFHDVRDFHKPETFCCRFEFLSHAEINFFRSPAIPATQMMVMSMTEAVDLGAILSNP